MNSSWIKKSTSLSNISSLNDIKHKKSISLDSSKIQKFITPIIFYGNTKPYEILYKMIKIIQKYGMNIDNLFDIKLLQQLDKNEVNSIKERFMNENIGDSLKINPRVVVEVMRQYLDSLDEPLLTFEMYDSFMLIPTIKIEEEKIKYIQSLLDSLPIVFKNSLKLLIQLFHQFIQLSSLSITSSPTSLLTQQDIVSYTTNIICNLFGPIILKPKEFIYYMENDKEIIPQIIQIFIEQIEHFF